MKSIAAAVVVALGVACGRAAAGEPTLDLSQGWRFSPGDDPKRSSPDYDDTAWESIRVGSVWEDAGHPDLDGYVWYRLRFHVGDGLLKSPRLEQTGMLVLRQARAMELPVRYLVRDLDFKYSNRFEKVFTDAGVSVKPTAPRAPNQNAFVERWIGSIRGECLNRFIAFGLGHLNHIVGSYLEY